MSHRRRSQEEDRRSTGAGVSCPGLNFTRREALLGALGLLGLWTGEAEASPIDPKETIVVLPGDIRWAAWTGLPENSGEMASLHGELDKAGPYVVLMKWHPGYMSAPHSYATDRLCVVVSGTWWVNSGKDFDPESCVPAPAGSFVRRVARTPHYDGVMKNAKEPAVIAIFGTGPVDLKLVDPGKPGWRKL